MAKSGSMRKITDKEHEKSKRTNERVERHKTIEILQGHDIFVALQNVKRRDLYFSGPVASFSEIFTYIKIRTTTFQNF